MPDEPPSILPRGTGMRRPLSPSPALPGSAVYIQSVAGFSCIAAGAIGSDDISGGRSPASINVTLHWGILGQAGGNHRPCGAAANDYKVELLGHLIPLPLFNQRAPASRPTGRDVSSRRGTPQ